MNCGQCKEAHLVQSGRIRCFLAHETIGGIELLLGGRVTQPNIPAPEWCPKEGEKL